MRTFCQFCLLSLLLSVIGCTGNASPTQNQTSATTAPTGVGVGKSESVETTDQGPVVTVIQPGEDAERRAQEALIVAEPGEIVEFAEGTFEFKGTLSLKESRVLRFAGKASIKRSLTSPASGQAQAGKG